MAMIAMPKLQFLASASFDGNLILWDTINYKKKRLFKEHKRGIVSLAFNEALILLFSAGFDHEICVWNPYIDNYIYKISAHSSPLIGIQVIENSTQVISIDMNGTGKVWDVKKFNCVQTFSLETSDDKHKFNPTTICFIPKPLKLVFGGRNITVYDYDKNYNPNWGDDYVALCAKFVPSSLTIVTPHANRIKMWNILSGDIKKIYSDICQSEITAFELDIYKKRMIIGEANGESTVLNVINGAKIKSLPKHAAEVIQILHIAKPDDPNELIFITAGMDNTIKLSHDREINESELIRTISFSDAFITSMNFEPLNSFIVAGTNIGQVGFWELDTGKLNGVFRETKDADINTLVVMDQIPYAFSGSAYGTISLIALPPLLFKYTSVLTYNNVDVEKGTPVGIVSVIVCLEKKLLYFADDKGILKCFNISKILSKISRSSFSKVRGRESIVSLTTRSLHVPPELDLSEFEHVYTIRAHLDQIKNLEYLPREEILITTAFDRKVKLWNSKTGAYYDSFQQSYDYCDIKPIGFWKIGTNEIYDIDYTKRVDIYFEEEELQKNKKDEEEQLIKDLKSRHTLISEKHIESAKTRLNYVKSIEEEFNPFHYYDQIDEKIAQQRRSNKWKVNFDFKKMYLEFEKEVNDLIDVVSKKEAECNEIGKKKGIMKHLDMAMFQEGKEEQNEENGSNAILMPEMKNNELDILKKAVKTKGSVVVSEDKNKKYTNVKSKLSSNKLYKTVLQSKLVDTHVPNIYLSEDGCD